MKRRLAVVISVAAGAFCGAAVVPHSAPVAAPVPAYAKACGSGYVHASLSWGHKCLRTGQYCKVARDREYHRYGFHCHTGGRLNRR